MGKPRGTARRLLSVLAAGLALTLVVTSCSSSDSEGGPDAPTDGAAGSITTAQLVAAFAGDVEAEPPQAAEILALTGCVVLRAKHGVRLLVGC